MGSLQEYLQFIEKTFSQNFYWVWTNLSIFSSPLVLIDTLIVAIIFYYTYRLLKNSKAFNILLGIAILGTIALVSQVLQLKAFSWLLVNAITILVVAIPIVFQPEIRNMLDRLGRSSMAIRSFWSIEQEKSDLIVNAIYRACTLFKQKKIGALLVFERLSKLDMYTEQAVHLQASITSQLLYAIFQKQSPLHDGAVIIRGDKLLVAGCSLPLSERTLSLHGLRHQAALGISEVSDASTIVVSEETGMISKISKGKIQENISDPQLLHALRKIYYVPERKMSVIESLGTILKNFKMLLQQKN